MSVAAEPFSALCAVFRSAIDSWAISQVFPVMPIHRLEQVGVDPRAPCCYLKCIVCGG